MFFLFTTETISFMQHTTETMVVLDPGRAQQVRRRLRRRMAKRRSSGFDYFQAGGALTSLLPALPPPRYMQIRINFNITLLDLPCRYAVVDVLDVLGTNTMNVSKNIEKVPPIGCPLVKRTLLNQHAPPSFACAGAGGGSSPSGTWMRVEGGGSSRGGIARRGILCMRRASLSLR